jgi:hypothetical protein
MISSSSQKLRDYERKLLLPRNQHRIATKERKMKESWQSYNLNCRRRKIADVNKNQRLINQWNMKLSKKKYNDICS